MILRQILAPLVSLLERKQIGYAVIGGYAVAAWGQVRATRDLDLYFSLKDLSLLKTSLEEAQFRFEHRIGDPDDPISDVIRINVSAEEDEFEVDILAGIKGAPAGLIRRARTIQIEDLALKVTGPEDLIILKLLAGSALDVEDARGILRVQYRTLDRALIYEICPESLKANLSDLLSDIR